MLTRLFQVKWIVFIIVLFTILNAIAFMAIGVYSSIEGYIGIIEGNVHSEEHPGLFILEALDIFLAALVFLIFAMGIAILFLTPNTENKRFNLPKWLEVKNFSDLKLLLWEAILTTLVVYFVSDIIKRDGNYTWDIILIPASILLLTVCLLILRRH
jgi:uncharacterized membrane protein YqhA